MFEGNALDIYVDFSYIQYHIYASVDEGNI